MLDKRAFHAFVGPVGSHSLFRYLIHPLGTDLHLHPSFVRPENGSMKRFIPILLRHGKPVAQTFGVRGKYIRNERIYLPAVRFLPLQRRIQDNTDSEKVIDVVHVTMLRLHLMIDRMDGLRPSFDRKDKTFRLEFLLQRRYKAGDIVFTLCFFRVQRVRDIFIGIVVEEFQRQILHFCLDLVQTQPVRHGSMQSLRLTRNMPAAVGVTFCIQLTEKLQTLV